MSVGRIEALKREMFAQVQIGAVTNALLQDWVDSKKLEISSVTGRRLKTSSIARNLSILKVAFSKAVEWQLLKSSPAQNVSCPILEDHRERIASDEDIEKLKIAAQWSEDEIPVTQSQRIVAAFIFACQTGMRIGEIEQLEISWINKNAISIPREVTKTYHGRIVAVPDRALKILSYPYLATRLTNSGDSMFPTMFQKPSELLQPNRCRYLLWTSQTACWLSSP